MHEPPQAANELSPWRALLLQMARPCLQTGAAGTTVCTLVGIANHFQVGEEMGRKGLCLSMLAGGALWAGRTASLSAISGLICLPSALRPLQTQPHWVGGVLMGLRSRVLPTTTAG